MEIGNLITKPNSLKKKVGKETKIIYMYGTNSECHMTTFSKVELVYTKLNVNTLAEGYTPSNDDLDLFINHKEYKSLKDKNGFNPLIIISDAA